MGRGAWWATAYGVAKNQTCLSTHMHARDSREQSSFPYFPTLCAHAEDRNKGAVCRPGRAPTVTKRGAVLISNIQPLELQENNGCCLSHLVCGMLLCSLSRIIYCIKEEPPTSALSIPYVLLYCSTQFFLTAWHILSSFVYCPSPFLEWKPSEDRDCLGYCCISNLKPVPGPWKVLWIIF